MPDWTSSMQQTFEYYIVDPITWKDTKLIDTVTSCTITRDSSVETLGSATIDIADSVGECYIRAYLITIQNGVREKHPLGTILVQTPSSKFDGKSRNVSMDAYTPLLELKEGMPPIGHFLPKGVNILDSAYVLAREHMRGPVVSATSDKELYFDFVSSTNDSWLSFATDLVSNAKYKLDLDEMGRLLFAPDQETAALQPVWEYNDSNSSILYPEITMDHDLYGIPNVIEVIYSTGHEHYETRKVNDDPNSPTSTVNRGREIVHRVTDLSAIGDPTNAQIDQYAERLLSELSTVEYTVSYTHGYCPTRVGDCVLLNYKKAGISNVKAKITKQSIKCQPGCPVTETAVFTSNLWR